MGCRWGTSLVFLLISSFASAEAGLTYHGRLLKADGEAVTEPVVKFKIQIRSPGTEDCLLYQETHLRDMSESNGAFAITINDGTAAESNAGPFALDRVFQNRGTFVPSAGECAQGASYTPQPTDGRRLVVSFNDGTFAPTDWETLPAQAINFVPAAMESLAVGGYGSGSLLRVHDGSGAPASIPALSNTQYNAFLSLLGGLSPLYLTSSSSLNGANLAGGSVDDTKLASGISGSKITGNISGSAAGFTGALTGDVTGTQSSTVVARIQGRSVDSAAPGDGQVLKWSSGHNRWEPADDSGGSGSVTGVTASAPLQSSGGTAPNLTIDDASTSAKGVVRLAASSDTAAGLVVQANDARLTDSRAPSGAAGGDLGGNYPNPDVVKIRGAAVSATSPQAGQVLTFSGGQWAPANFGIGDLKTWIGGAQFASATCSPTQTLNWSSLTDTFTCTNITFPTESDPKVGANTTDALSKWNGSALVASAVHESAGRVGIGTASPDGSAALDVSSTDKGFLPPRLTTAQKTAIASPAEGLIVFDTDEKMLFVYRNSSWTKISDLTEVAFSVNRNGVNQSIANTTATDINWTTKAFDTANAFDLSTDRFTPTTAGYYFVTVSVRYDNVAADRRVQARLLKNGVMIGMGDSAGGSSTSDISAIANQVVYLDGVSDYLTAATYHNSGSSIPLYGVASSTSFSGFLISGGTGAGGGGGGIADQMGDHVATKNITLGGNYVSGDGDDEGLRIDGDGNVGIGTATPRARLDVEGEIKVGNTSSTCDATKEGQMRYNSATKKMEYCNATAWVTPGGFSSCTTRSANFSSGSVTVNCNVGETMTGGGYSAQPFGICRYNYPNGNGWTAGSCVLDGDGSPVTGTAYVRCCQ